MQDTNRLSHCGLTWVSSPWVRQGGTSRKLLESVHAAAMLAFLEVQAFRASGDFREIYRPTFHHLILGECLAP